mmetsp:Transcript_45348/g.106429  ORF Transcript_45348/g.106429 Transcript_45348/m.106429 type:complete len:93 (+) Transcript_45348:2248-2526(+)
MSAQLQLQRGHSGLCGPGLIWMGWAGPQPRQGECAVPGCQACEAQSAVFQECQASSWPHWPWVGSCQGLGPGSWLALAPATKRLERETKERT